MSEKNYYIENVHNAPITCTAKDKVSGRVLCEKKFYHAMNEKWTGKTISTGFTKLTAEEYKILSEHSKGFIQYKDNPKKKLSAPLLVLHDDLPPEAKTPHEALADARRERREAAKKIEGLNAEITELKAKLHDADEKYRTLESASTDEEKLKPLNDQITDLTGKNKMLDGFANNLVSEVGKLAAMGDKIKSGDIKLLVDTSSRMLAEITKKKDFE